MSCTSAVCALLPFWSLLLIAAWQRPGILPAFVSASAWRVGPERKAKELFTQPLCSTGLSVCPAGSAPAGGPFRASEGGWVEWGGRMEWDEPAGWRVERDWELCWWRVCGLCCSVQGSVGCQRGLSSVTCRAHFTFGPDSR